LIIESAITTRSAANDRGEAIFMAMGFTKEYINEFKKHVKGNLNLSERLKNFFSGAELSFREEDLYAFNTSLVNDFRDFYVRIDKKYSKEVAAKAMTSFVENQLGLECEDITAKVECFINKSGHGRY
jgi:hypothetical protein